MPTYRTPLQTGLVLFLMTASGCLAHAGETPSLGLGLEYQRWLEDDGHFVAEHGYLPRVELRYQTDLAREHGWQALANGSGGTVDYRGSSQGQVTGVDSHSRYRKGVAQLAYWWRLNGATRLSLDLGAAAWRRDIHNPLLNLDQREDYRSAWAGATLAYQLAVALEASAGVAYPFWTRLDAQLDTLGFSASPSLRPKGRPSPALSLHWRATDTWSLNLDWTSLRFAASPAVELGGARVHQPRSRLDSIAATASMHF